jgi:hypothetical protein
MFPIHLGWNFLSASSCICWKLNKLLQFTSIKLLLRPTSVLTSDTSSLRSRVSWTEIGYRSIFEGKPDLGAISDDFVHLDFGGTDRKDAVLRLEGQATVALSTLETKTGESWVVTPIIRLQKLL